MDLLFYLLLIGLGAAAVPMGDTSFDDGLDLSGTLEDPGIVAPDDGDDFDETFDETLVAPEPPPEEVPEVDDPSAGFVAEDQTATGKMTTATEVRPILTATKGSWIAVREWEGEDLLYFTNLLAWRCGLHQISYSVNGGPLQVLEAEPCYTEEGAPNALRVEDILPYVTLPPQSVETVTISVLYDDLSTDTADYSRSAIQIN